ncbi:family 78 glycoside hydrolase catalytic domain [Terrimonas pollutisoli]|uniref:family 78 glycoside hydrolase catalytic domain n=1 Tax=Terrimonas pollutisoli TaxID=3034147 RepID=UPI0023ED9992|nr:family 78 glycoside hydrolase catalytic domain [Terrimonas sp. H1YJ31]
MQRFLYSVIVLLVTLKGFSQQLTVTNLRCEYRKDPSGVDNLNPHFSWELQSNERNVLQTGYQVLVADDSLLLIKNIGNVWDSKKIISRSSIQVEYKGKALQPAKKYFWKVMVWDNKKQVSGWSNMATWQMGLLKKSDWNNAKWIAYEEINDSAIIVPLVHGNGKKVWGARRNALPIFRKEFSIYKKIKSATAFVCGLGHFEMYINGKKIGDHFLDPGWTNYSKHAQYVSFDITGEMQQGSNAIVIMLGNGFYYIPGQRYRKMTGAYGLPKMIIRTIIEYTDGSSSDIVSDENWKASSSPIIFSSIFGGEDYDASLEQAGWNGTGFDDSHWKKVVVTTGPLTLDGASAEPLKIMQRFTPVSKTQLDANTWMYDLAQNFSGIPSITVKGNKSDTVKITPSELINKDGTANQKATGSPSYYTYILKGEGDESWQPRFSYYGFRYLQVQVIATDTTKSLPVVKNIEGLHIRNAAGTVGAFNCSNELFNKTNTLINWAIKSNMMSVFTDCPHREKLGWLEQTHLMGASVQYNYDIAGMCRKVIRDMMNAQYPDGKIPEIAPEFTKFTPPFDESPEWGSAAIILPWYNYQWYGDKQTLAEAYGMMKGYLMYLKSKTKNNILSHGLGDWFDIGPNKSGFAQMTKMGITSTATFYYDLTIMTKVAKLLNKPADAKVYQQLASQVKRSFNANFFDQQKMQYDSASQTANAMALYMNLVEPKHRQAVVNALINDIRNRNNALTAGDIGYRYVLRALEEAGRSDVIFDMNSRDDVPGYGFQLKHGATALTESWQAYESVSNNHFMLGHLMEWFYAGLAGIKQTKNSVAYKEILIRPEPVGNVTNAKASYHSPYGSIRVRWERKENEFDLHAEIPVNTTAIIHLPASKTSIVSRDGKKIRNSYENGRAIVKCGSGKYNFTVND